MYVCGYVWMYMKICNIICTKLVCDYFISFYTTIVVYCVHQFKKVNGKAYHPINVRFSDSNYPRLELFRKQSGNEMLMKHYHT